MSHEFYTNYTLDGSKILLRYVDEQGKRRLKKIQGKDYAPTFYVESQEKTDYKNIYGQYLKPKTGLNSIYDAKKWLNETHETVYGRKDIDRMFIDHTFDYEKISNDWDIKKISISYFDIETESENGYPDINTPLERINLITLYESLTDVYYVFGLEKDYKPKQANVKYIKCETEKDLIERFIKVFGLLKPDILSGWNIEGFDIPYLFNRTSVLFKDKADGLLKGLSPWMKYQKRQSYDQFGKEFFVYKIQGVEIIDYFLFYKKIVLAPRPNYKLDTIVGIELNAEKLKHESGIPGHKLYNDYWESAVDYNIRDVSLLVDLEEKVNVIYISMMVAYSSLVNYSDIMSQLRVWTNRIHNYLNRDNIFVQAKFSPKDKSSYAGGYVKDPQKGKHKWLVSFDVASMYPNLIRALNIGPETVTDKVYPNALNGSKDDQGHVAERYLHQEIDLSEAKIDNLSVGCNGITFSNKEKSYLSKMVSDLYSDRSRFKKMSQEMKEKAKNESNPNLKDTYLNDAHRFNITQMSLKIVLNSLYGAMGNEYFMFYDLRLASAITLTGQVMIKWIAKNINKVLNEKLGVSNQDYCIMSDTDSVVFELDKYVEKFCDATDRNNIVDFLDEESKIFFQKIINDSIIEMCDYLNAFDPGSLSMKREAIADSGIFVAKKHYIMNLLDDEGYRFPVSENNIGKLKINGISATTGAVSPILKQWFNDLIPVMLHSDVNDLRKAYLDKKDAFMKLDVEDFGQNKSVNKLSAYSDEHMQPIKGCPFQVKAALAHNRMVSMFNLDRDIIKDKDKIKYAYLQEPNFLGSNAIGWVDDFPEFLKDKDVIDYEVNFEKFFRTPLENILTPMGWELEETPTLDDLF